jgi:hypothetical protein
MKRSRNEAMKYARIEVLASRYFRLESADYAQRSLAIGLQISCFNQFRASFRPLPGLKPGSLAAAIWIAARSSDCALRGQHEPSR